MTPPRLAPLPRFTHQRPTTPARRAQRVRASLPRLAAQWCAARQRVAHAKGGRVAGWQGGTLAGWKSCCDDPR
jgi:hypothetical protein